MRCSIRIEPTCRNSRGFVLDQSSTGSGDDSWTGSGLTDMRRQSLRQVAIALLICGLVLIPLVPVVLGPTTNGPITVFTLLLGSFVTLILSDRHSRLAAWILIASLLALLGQLLLFQPESAVLPWFAVVVLLAGFLIGPAAGAVLA